MRDLYPTICDWVEHKTVATTALREELQRALDWIDSCDPERCPSACSEGHTYDNDSCAMSAEAIRARDVPRPWDGHACSAMLPAPHGHYCPWCGTQPARDVSYLGTEDEIFGDNIDDEPSHGYWEAGDHG